MKRGPAAIRSPLAPPDRQPPGLPQQQPDDRQAFSVSHPRPPSFGGVENFYSSAAKVAGKKSKPLFFIRIFHWARELLRSAAK